MAGVSGFSNKLILNLKHGPIFLARSATRSNSKAIQCIINKM